MSATQCPEVTPEREKERMSDRKNSAMTWTKGLALSIIVLGLLIAIVPQYTYCRSGGPGFQAHTVEGAGGAAVMAHQPMRCMWTARATLLAGVPLAVMGALLLFSPAKRKEPILGILTITTGVLTMLIPTYILGTCMDPSMICNMAMKPALLLAGGITVAVGGAVCAVGAAQRAADTGQIPSPPVAPTT
jgi:hypothetical protein